VKRYQSDWRLQLLLTFALVMSPTDPRFAEASDGVAECRCLDILLEMDSHDLHLVDQHALDLRHYGRRFVSFEFITSVYVDGDRCASAAIHCMSFLSNPP
jgi:hypothetical protein